MPRTGILVAMCCVLVLCFACKSGSDDLKDDARYLLISVLNDFCVDVPAASMEEGKQLILWSVNSYNTPTPNQTWRLSAAGNNGEYKIISEANSMCLSVEEAAFKDGASIIQLPNKENTENQIWIFKKNNKHYTISSKLNGKMLTVPGYGADKGVALVQFEPIDNADNQAFRLTQIR